MSVQLVPFPSVLRSICQHSKKWCCSCAVGIGSIIIESSITHYQSNSFYPAKNTTSRFHLKEFKFIIKKTPFYNSRHFGKTWRQTTPKDLSLYIIVSLYTVTWIWNKLKQVTIFKFTNNDIKLALSTCSQIMSQSALSFKRFKLCLN